MIKNKNTLFLRIFNIIWPIICAGMVASICYSAVVIFNNFTYAQIFVDGSSMNPTLNGSADNSNFGKMDITEYARKRIYHYDIVITYYPEDYEGGYNPGKVNTLKKDATYKIKRVYALPNETFSFNEHDGVTTYDSENKVIKRYARDYGVVVKDEKPASHRAISPKNPKKLADNQYYVMGDNWADSYDSYDSKKVGPIYYENIVGVLYSINGHGKRVSSTEIVDMVNEPARYFKRGQEYA